MLGNAMLTIESTSTSISCAVAITNSGINPRCCAADEAGEVRLRFSDLSMSVIAFLDEGSMGAGVDGCEGDGEPCLSV